MNIRDLLEKDKERLMTRLANAVSPEQAARECEDELGRLLLEYNEQAPSDRVSEAAYYSMQTARAAISLVDSTGEIRAYERTGSTEVSGKNYVIPLAGGIGAISLVDSTGEIRAYERTSGTEVNGKKYVIPLAGGIGCMAAGGLVLALAPAVLAPVGLIGLIAGFAGTFVAGVRFGGRRSVPGNRDQIFETRVDGGKIYSNLLRMMTVIDRNLQDIHGREQQETPAIEMKSEKAESEELELLSGILESAYARRDEGDAEDTISNIKFYLHRRGIDVVDYSADTERWFNKMPSKRRGTLRPALVKDGAVLIRGIAQGGM